MKFDDILKEVGEFGRYQKWVSFFTCLPVIHIGALILLNVIIFGVPEHRCKIPGLDNDTWNDNSPEHQALVKYYIPPSDTYPYDRCHLYDRSNGSVANNSMVKCDTWVYDTSVFGETFTTKESLICDRAFWISVAQTIYYAGVLVGSIAFGQLADILGRKKAFYIGLMTLMVSLNALTFAPEFYSFVVIYFVIGSVSVSTVMCAYVLGMEFVGPSKRVMMGTILATVVGIGSLYLILMSYLLKDWQKTQLSIGIPAVVYVGYICIFPESARWLLSNGRKEEAIRILANLAKHNNKELSKEVLYSLEVDESSQKGKLWQLFSTKVLALRTLVLCLNWFVVSMAYYGVILNVGNIGGDFYLNLVLLTIIEYPVKISTLFILNRLGRKKVYVAYMLVGGIMCIGTIYPVVKKHESLNWLLVTLSVLGKMFVSGAFDVLYILSSELFPTVVRNVGMGTCSACARAGSMLSPYIAQLADTVDVHFAKAIPLTVFGAVSIIGGMLSILLPETVNKKLPDTIEEAHHFDRKQKTEISVPISRRERTEYSPLLSD